MERSASVAKTLANLYEDKDGLRKEDVAALCLVRMNLLSFKAVLEV